MPAIYVYLGIVLIGLFFFLKIQWVLARGHAHNLYLMRKRGDAQQIISLESTSYAWSIAWVLLFVIILAYCAVMVLIANDLARIDIFIIMAVFFAFYIKQAITYMTAEFVKQRMVAKP